MTRQYRHIFLLAAILLGVLSATACHRDEGDGKATPELQVALYVPRTAMTRASTDPTAAEAVFSSLHIWVFLSEDGTLVSYKGFQTNLDQTGLSNNTITRFGLPLTEEMFTLLTTETGTGEEKHRTKVDIYAVANVASAISGTPGEYTTRDQLDQLVLTGFGSDPLVMEVPSAGLPMSGVLKEASASGGYPVLNITTVKLTKAVSKIRFAFCQQAKPATDSNPVMPVNSHCQIVSIVFDGTDNGHDCQIAASEKLFTTNTAATGSLFDIGSPAQYVPLSASLTGDGGAPLIPNASLALAEDPENLGFRSPGHDSESAESYETRLNAMVGAGSQVGPIYLRETDKLLSGTITYRISEDGPDLTAPFSMQTGDVFSRNHSWIVYACFVEETMSLSLRVVELPWDWETYTLDYTDATVNVVRRFTVFETTPPTFTKVQTEDGFFDVTFWHTVQVEDLSEANALLGDIIIATPVGAKLHVIPVPGVQEGHTFIPGAFTVTPSQATIYPNYVAPDNPDGRIEHCRIPIHISCNNGPYSDEDLEGNYIDLHFCVETVNGQFIDLGSESIDYYRFILSKNWDQSTSGSND